MAARGELDLIGQIVQANVDQAAHTTNMLLSFKDEEIKRLAKALVEIQEAIDDAIVIDRMTERRLKKLRFETHWAAQLLYDMEAQS